VKDSQKPVHNCHGCGLNLGDHCGMYPVPREMWHERICPGFKNEAMLRQYQEEQARHPEDPRKARRCEIARLRATEPHHQGRAIPVHR
jgi:hypothetical protein